MYIYTGLLKLCANEAELASVMGHELGHVTAHHHGQALTRQYGLDLLVGLVVGGNASATAELLAQLGESVVQLRFSRGQEYHADQLGMDFIFRAGYRPEAMIDFMRKMYATEQQHGGGMGLTFLSSHPATPERIANLESLLQRYPLELRAQNPLYMERYRTNVLNRLR
jgi:predicted Zn-dependent protease